MRLQTLSMSMLYCLLSLTNYKLAANWISLAVHEAGLSLKKHITPWTITWCHDFKKWLRATVIENDSTFMNVFWDKSWNSWWIISTLCNILCRIHKFGFIFTNSSSGNNVRANHTSISMHLLQYISISISFELTRAPVWWRIHINRFKNLPRIVDVVKFSVRRLYSVRR